MRWLIAVVVPLVCLASVVAQERGPRVRFAAVEVRIDPKGRPLAAWQVELAAEVGEVSLVGVEAGEHAAYAKRPAYYDPAALAGRRIILGDYSLEKELPVGVTRVARVMVEVRGEVEPKYVVKLMAAADAEGKGIEVDVMVR